jgi:hypothetical protein
LRVQQDLDFRVFVRGRCQRRQRFTAECPNDDQCPNGPRYSLPGQPFFQDRCREGQWLRYHARTHASRDLLAPAADPCPLAALR